MSSLTRASYAAPEKENVGGRDVLGEALSGIRNLSLGDSAQVRKRASAQVRSEGESSEGGGGQEKLEGAAAAAVESHMQQGEEQGTAET